MTNTKPTDKNSEDIDPVEIENTTIISHEFTSENIILPDRTPKIPPKVFEDLVKNNAQELLAFFESYDKKRFDIVISKEENRHKETIVKENNRDKNKSAREQTLRISLGCVAAFLILVLPYSYFSGNKDLPEKVFYGLLAAFGGTGLTSLRDRDK